MTPRAMLSKCVPERAKKDKKRRDGGRSGNQNKTGTDDKRGEGNKQPTPKQKR